jgi:hypothetical protein
MPRLRIAGTMTSAPMKNDTSAANAPSVNPIPTGPVIHAGLNPDELRT